MRGTVAGRGRRAAQRRAVSLLLLFALALPLAAGCSALGTGSGPDAADGKPAVAATVADVPAYEGEPYAEVADNEPGFSDAEIAQAAEAAEAGSGMEKYSELDELGRCETATACVGPETMPEGERGSIGMVKPSGWHTSKYEFVDGKYLYNRCHLVGWQLTGENANDENLITGTRYMNTEGMLPFENEVADYVDETGNHVLYRVTPDFEGDELVARGVQMEAVSVEDGGAGVSFNVYCYNVQPGVEIDYETGDNWESENSAEEIAAAEEAGAALDEARSGGSGAQGSASGSEADKDAATGSETDETPRSASGSSGGLTDDGREHAYVLNTRSRKFHLPDCPGVESMSDRNRQDVTTTRDSLVQDGYSPCGTCQP